MQNLRNVGLFIFLANVLGGLFGLYNQYLIRDIPLNERLLGDMPYVVLTATLWLQLLIWITLIVFLFVRDTLILRARVQFSWHKILIATNWAGLLALPFLVINVVFNFFIFY
jgi:hypothetical protein